MARWIPMDLKQARITLFELKHLLDSLDIKFWLIKGTLLGVIRENRFMPSDNDIDLLVMRDSLSDRLLKALDSQDYNHEMLSCPSLFYALVLRKTGRALSGFHFNYYYEPEDICIVPVDQPELSASLYRGDHFVDFLGEQFRVPYPPEEWLARVYGNWQVVHKKHWMRGRKRISIDKYVKWIIKHPDISGCLQDKSR